MNSQEGSSYCLPAHNNSHLQLVLRSDRSIVPFEELQKGCSEPSVLADEHTGIDISSQFSCGECCESLPEVSEHLPISSTSTLLSSDLHCQSSPSQKLQNTGVATSHLSIGPQSSSVQLHSTNATSSLLSSGPQSSSVQLHSTNTTCSHLSSGPQSSSVQLHSTNTTSSHLSSWPQSLSVQPHSTNATSSHLNSGQRSLSLQLHSTNAASSHLSSEQQSSSPQPHSSNATSSHLRSGRQSSSVQLHSTSATSLHLSSEQHFQSLPLNQPEEPPSTTQLLQRRGSSSSSFSELSDSGEDYQTGSSDSNLPERSWSPAAAAAVSAKHTGSSMGGSVSRSEEVEQAQPSYRHSLQPPEQRGWSLALTTQPQQFDSAPKNHFSGIYQSERLEKEKVETTYTEETPSKADSLVSQGYTSQRSFESLVVSECEPKLKSKARATPRYHQHTGAQHAAKEELRTENGSVDPHPLERLERSVAHKVTLKLWIEEERLLRSRTHEQEAYCTSAERDVYLILGLNFLFQAIIVGGTAQASALDCHSSWVPLIMSLIVSIATFLATVRKLGAREELLSRLRAYKTDTRVILQYIDKLRSLGDLFDLMDLPQLTSSLPKGRANCFPRKLIGSFSLFVLLILSLFSVITFVSFRSILCHH